MPTDRDITIRAIAKGHNPSTTPVRDVMASDVVYCFESQDTQEVAQLMAEHRIRRMLVVDRNKRLSGIVSLGDPAVATGDASMSVQVLQQVPAPTKSGSMPQKPRSAPADQADATNENQTRDTG